MSAKTLKNNKKTKISKKSYIFWGAIAAAVILLIVSLIIFALNNRGIVNYENVEFLDGQEIYEQEEDKYLVLFYNFNYEKDMETFDNTMYTYLEYYRNNSSKDGVLKMYGADCDTETNRVVLVDGDSNIQGTTKHPFGAPSWTNPDATTILKINETSVPVLLVVTDGTVTDYKTGETAISVYLQTIKNK